MNRRSPHFRNGRDEDRRDLERRAASGDAEALREFVQIAKDDGDWAAVNRAMDEANYPTWNAVAPWAYRGVESAPEADQREGQRILHELIATRTFAGDDEDGDLTWRKHTFPLLDVLVGGAGPARMFDDPGVHRGRYDPDDPKPRPPRAWIKGVPWTSEHPPPARRSNALYAVLDEEDEAVTIANSMGGDADQYDPSWDRTGWLWEIKESPLGWLGWARNSAAYDRIRAPLGLARGLLERMREFVEAEGRRAEP